MNATPVLLNQTSIVRHILLGRGDSALRIAMEALELQSILFSRIGALAVDGDAVADLVRLGCCAADEDVVACREFADSGDIVSAVDCLARVQRGHRIASNLLATIVEVGNADVAELAQFGVNLANSVLNDLGGIPE